MSGNISSTNGFVQRLLKRVPYTPAPPGLDDLKASKSTKGFSSFSFFKRRIKLKPNSSISIPLGFVLLFPSIVVLLILILVVKHPSSPGRILIPAGTPPSIRKISEKHDRVFATGCLNPEDAAKQPRANAAFVVLARNQELEGIKESIRSIERHFNRWFHYPYVFLNDGEFTEEFKKGVQNHTSGKTEFGQIDSSMWGFPSWVDADVAREGIQKQGDAVIMYGGMESYHHMCRFYSGFFYKHPLLEKYEWYWRLEPDIKYFCDITYDPFIEMARNNKTYGFTIAVKELKETVPNIFRYASAYKRKNKIKSQGLWEMFLEPEPKKTAEKTDGRELTLPDEILQTEVGHQNIKEIDPENMEGEKYNMCHFWSNFEIARLDWFRSREYEEFFQMMDHSGGFWMERWGDAPIHSLAAGALLAPKDIHYFRDFGYRHTTIQHCPANAPARQSPPIPWNDKTKFPEKDRLEEEEEYWANPDPPKENGVGCRCRCDTDIRDVEGKEGSCLAEWVEVAGGWASP